MPRQSRGPAPAPRRPAPPPARPAPAPQQQQTRSASTAAHPPAQQAQAPPAQQSQGPGLFGQMASTAAGVAVGSSIGHAIGGFFGGGSTPAPVQEAQSSQQAADAQNAYAQAQNQGSGQRTCGIEVDGFKRCMDENQGNLTICGWYLDQLKACQQAAAPY